MHNLCIKTCRRTVLCDIYSRIIILTKRLLLPTQNELEAPSHSSDVAGRTVLMLYCTGIMEVEPHKQPFCLQCQLEEAASWFLCSFGTHATQKRRSLDLCCCRTKRRFGWHQPSMPSFHTLSWQELWNVISDDNRVQCYSWCHIQRGLGSLDVFCMTQLLCSMADRQFVSSTRGDWGMQLGVGFPHYL